MWCHTTSHPLEFELALPYRGTDLHFLLFLAMEDPFKVIARECNAPDATRRARIDAINQHVALMSWHVHRSYGIYETFGKESYSKCATKTLLPSQCISFDAFPKAENWTSPGRNWVRVAPSSVSCIQPVTLFLIHKIYHRGYVRAFWKCWCR